MTTPPSEAQLLPLRDEADIVRARRAVREVAQTVGMGLVDQTKLVTAASELARNTVVHGGGGRMRVQPVEAPPRRGVRLRFEDHGPGIEDAARAMSDGFTTRRGLGLGLGGARRLVDEFELHSTPGQGTSVTLVRWCV